MSVFFEILEKFEVHSVQSCVVMDTNLMNMEFLEKPGVDTA